jgi:hypothetical protein
MLDRVINGSVQIGQHLGFQITASGFHQLRFRYAVLLCFPKAAMRSQGI